MALVVALPFVWADTPAAQTAQGRVIYMATIEPRGGAQQDKEPFPQAALPAGDGYRKTPPDANGRWEVVTADDAGHPRGAAQVGERTVMNVTRREVVKATLAAVAAGALLPRVSATAATEELKVPDNVPVDTFDFEAKGIESWTTVDGQWAVEDMAGAPSGKKVLVQRGTKNEFNVVVAPPGPYTDVDVSMKFKPISGREDASGGIVFRFTDGKYYVVRANALEDNFRLYYYDRGRRQIATARVKAPELGQWHTVRVVALGDHVQAWLDGKLHLDHRDSRFKSGRVGLWTKADSITAFDDLTIRGVTGGA